MGHLSITHTIKGSAEEVVSLVTESIKKAGFGILTRIDFDKKMKEKLDKDLPPTIILGACNPALAYEAYTRSTDVALLVPCNVVLTQTKAGEFKVEAMRPSAMLGLLPALKDFADQVAEADRSLEAALKSIS